MNGLLSAFTRNPRVLALTAALLVVAGLSSLTALPRLEDPRIRNRMAMVLTPFPGATAERVEALVSEPLEGEFRQMPELLRVESTSLPGFSLVTLEARDTVADMERLWSEARDQLADVTPLLPAGASPPEFDDDRGYAYTLILGLTWRGPGDRDMGVLRRYGKELQSRLRGVSGTDLVTLYGDPTEEILVTVDAARSTALRLGVADVARALARADTKLPAGTLRGPRQETQLEVAGEFDGLERVRDVTVRVDEFGVATRVGDLASVRRQIKSPPDDLAFSDGERALVVAVRALGDVRVDRWLATVRERVAAFDRDISANVSVDVVFDQGRYTETRLGELMANITVGFLLIVGVLLVTLGWRAALVTAAALPLTTLFALTAMRLIDLPIHQMSVTGLIVALGIMVDNAIVMTDYVQQRRLAGAGRLDAVRQAVGHLWLPLLGSTLTTILAFAPIALMAGPAGEFVGGIALSVIASLVGSYLVSHTLIAGLAGRFVSGSEGDRRWYRQGIQVPAVAAAYRRLLRAALRRPGYAAAACLVLPVSGFLAAGSLSEQFFPPSDRDMFQIELHLPPQAGIEATVAATHRLESALAQYPEIAEQHWFVGRNAPSFYYNLMQRNDRQSNFAQGMIKTVDFRATNRLAPRLQRHLDDAFPGYQILVRKLEQGPPFVAPVELRVFGPNLDRLRAIGDEIRRVMAATEDVVHTTASLADAQPKVRLRVDEPTLRQTGLSLADVADQLQATTEGVVSGSLLEGTEEIDVRVRLSDLRRRTLADLQNFTLAGRAPSEGFDHNAIPVAAVGEPRIEPASGGISRRNGERVNTLGAYLRPDVLPATALARVLDNLEAADLRLPAGYRLEVGGESAERDDAVGLLLSSVGVIVTLLIAVIVLSFNSFRLSGVILAVAAQSAGLGLLCVYLGGYPFGFTVIVALMGLAGLAINAAIVILAEIRADAAAATGDPEAIENAVMHTTRHIVSTTITTVGGFLPLILAGGGFWPPFAVAVAGGTVLTTTLSLVFVPAAARLIACRRPIPGTAAQPAYSS